MEVRLFVTYYPESQCTFFSTTRRNNVSEISDSWDLAYIR